ncbi:MAG: hypothetical protein HQK96_10885 [Nitrospirae bacterium]|nr:hypothetical protein [Nitrospirota bacterium]
MAKDNVISLIIQAKDAASAVLENVKNKLTESGKAVEGLNQSSGGTSSFLSGITGSLGSFLVSIGAAAAAYKGFQALLSIPMKGLEFNKDMETSKIGIASIITATTELISQDGRRLTGMEKLNEAQKISTDLMKQLQIAGLETTATTQELVAAFQSYIGPATAAGLNMKQTKEFTLLMVQGLGALGIEMNQLSAEGRSLLDGSIVPTQDRLATALGITGQMVDRWKSSGTYWQELTKHLEAFKLSGEAVANTWAGLASNMKDAISFISGKLTEGLFEGIKTSWKALLATLIDTKNFDVGSGIKNLFAGAKVIADDIGKLLVSGVKGFIDILKDANTFIGQNKGQFMVIYETIKELIVEYGKILAIIPQITIETIKWGVESSTVSGILKTVSATSAAMKDLSTIVITAFQAIGVAIIDLIMIPVSQIFGIIGKGFQAIGGYITGNALSAVSDQLKGSIAAVNKGLADSAKLNWENGSAVKSVLTSTDKVGESAKKAATAQAKGTSEVQAQAKAAELLKTSMEGVSQKYQETLKQLESAHNTRTVEIEFKFSGMEAGTAREKAVYLELLGERQKYYQDLIAEAEKYNTKQQAVADKETANIEAAYKRQEIAVVNTMQAIAQNYNNPIKTINLTQQLASEQKVLDGIRLQQAEIVKVKIEKAREAMSGIAAALKDTEQKEKEYADSVKKLNNEILTSEVSLASEVSSIKQTRMSADWAVREKGSQARAIEDEAEKQAAKGNLDIAKQFYGEAKAIYADLAKSAGNNYSQYFSGLRGVERSGEKYIEILKQEKAETQSRWEAEQKNVADLKKGLEDLTKTLLDLKTLLESLRGQGEINFKATGLTEIEDSIKAIIANDGKQVVIKVVEEKTTTQGKNKGGLVTAFASGGQVPGGYGTQDTVDAKLTPGEFVIPAGIVRKFTPSFFYDLINMKVDASSLSSMFKSISRPNISIPKIPHYNTGGLVGGSGGMMTLDLKLGDTIIRTYTDRKNASVVKQLNKELDRSRKTGYQG